MFQTDSLMWSFYSSSPRCSSSGISGFVSARRAPAQPEAWPSLSACWLGEEILWNPFCPPPVCITMAPLVEAEWDFAISHQLIICHITERHPGSSFAIILFAAERRFCSISQWSLANCVFNHRKYLVSYQSFSFNLSSFLIYLFIQVSLGPRFPFQQVRGCSDGLYETVIFNCQLFPLFRSWRIWKKHNRKTDEVSKSCWQTQEWLQCSHCCVEKLKLANRLHFVE